MTFWGMHLERPWWLLALLAAAFLLLLMRHHHQRADEWHGVIDKHLRTHVLQRPSGTGAPIYLIALAWLMAITALTGPAWQKIPQPLQQSESALIMVLDLSPSMYAQDISPSRLERARNKLNDVLDRREEGLIGLIAYGADAFRITPLTDDNDTVRNLLNALSPETLPRSVWGSNLKAAFDEASLVMLSGGVQRARILLVTDSLEENDRRDLAPFLRDGTMKLSILGIGTPNGAPVPLPSGKFFVRNGNTVIAKFDPRPSRRLATEYGGRYRSLALDDGDILYLLPEDSYGGDTRETERLSDVWRPEGVWLALFLLPLALLGFRRGWLLSSPLLVSALLASLVPPPANALEWSELWQRPDQQGASMVNTEEYAQAAERFEDPYWQGFAHYKNENYQAALESWPTEGDATLHYNRGNALAAMGKLKEAIAAYDASLDLDPEFRDAHYNRALLESLLPPGQQSPSQGQQGDNAQQQQGESGSGSQASQSNQAQGQEGSEGSQSEQEGSSGSSDDNREQLENYAKQQIAREQDEQQQQEDGQGAGSTSDENRQQGQSEENQSRMARGQDNNGDDGEQSNEDIYDLATLLEREGSADADSEHQQSLRALLRQIPDNPRDLLTRKLYYQHAKREQEDRSRIPKSDAGY